MSYTLCHSVNPWWNPVPVLSFGPLRNIEDSRESQIHQFDISTFTAAAFNPFDSAFTVKDPVAP